MNELDRVTMCDLVMGDISVRDGGSGGIGIKYMDTLFDFNASEARDLEKWLGTRIAAGYAASAVIGAVDVYDTGLVGVSLSRKGGRPVVFSSMQAEELHKWLVASNHIRHGMPVTDDSHASDCATHNSPALPKGSCDCGAEGREGPVDGGQHLSCDLSLQGSAPEMRAVDQRDVPGKGGFAILCAGDSPRVWFNAKDEISVFEWLSKRGPLSIMPLKWADLEVSDDLAGVDIKTTDGVYLRISDSSAWDLRNWLGIKLGLGLPREQHRLSDGDLFLGGSFYAHDDGDLGMSIKNAEETVAWFNAQGELDLLEWLQTKLSRSPNVSCAIAQLKVGELAINDLGPVGFEIVGHKHVTAISNKNARRLYDWIIDERPERKRTNSMTCMQCGVSKPVNEFETPDMCKQCVDDKPVTENKETIATLPGKALAKIEEELKDDCESVSVLATTEDKAADRMLDIERGHGGRVMRLRDLPDEYAGLKAWVGGKYNTRNILAVLKNDGVRLKWYTPASVISVAVRLPGGTDDRGYLGATADARAARPGETWTRGNDLADGPYCEDTWRRIVADAALWDAQPLYLPDIVRKADNTEPSKPRIKGMQMVSCMEYAIEALEHALSSARTGEATSKAGGNTAQSVFEARKAAQIEEAVAVLRAVAGIYSASRVIIGAGVNVADLNGEFGVKVGVDVADVIATHMSACCGLHFKIAAESGSSFPPALDLRVISDNRDYDSSQFGVYPKVVAIGNRLYRVSLYTTPAIDGVSGMEESLDRLVGYYVNDIARLTSDGVTVPLVRIDSSDSGVSYRVYWYSISACDGEGGAK